MLFSHVHGDAGTFRKKVLPKKVHPLLISYRMKKLCLDVRTWPQNLLKENAEKNAAYIFRALIDIHPFEKGTKRFAELISNRYLSMY